MKLTSEQIAALSAALPASAVKDRKQGGSKVSYIEGWHVIAEANRIFGFGAWQRETVMLDCVSQRERKIGRDQSERDGWGVTYVARVRVTVHDDDGNAVVREGCGAGHGIDADIGQAHESALKEAETDAMKRAMMTFGNPFGLALYDKERRNVEDDRAPPAPPQQPRTPPAALPPDARFVPNAAEQPRTPDWPLIAARNEPDEAKRSQVFVDTFIVCAKATRTADELAALEEACGGALDRLGKTNVKARQNIARVLAELQPHRLMQAG